MAFIIDKLADRYFTFQRDGGNVIGESAPTATFINSVVDFKTQNGANIAQQVLVTEITVLDTYGGSGSFTFTTPLQLFTKLKDLGFWWYLSIGVTGSNRFDDLADTFAYFGNNGKVPVVNSALNKLVPTTFYNVQKFIDLADTPSVLIADKWIKVNSAGTGLVFANEPTGTGDPFLNAYGWEVYTDSGNTVNYTGATANFELTNDADTVNDTYKAFGIGNSYDGLNNAFDFSAYSLGDSLNIKVSLEIDTTVTSQNLAFNVKKAIGTGSETEETVYQQIGRVVAGINSVDFDFNILIDSNDLRTAEAKLIFFSDDDADIVVDKYEITAVRRNINVTAITATDDTASHPKGDYNIITNTPPLADGVGQIGDYYTLTTAGSRNFGSGSISFGIDDRIEYDGFLWFKAVDNNQSAGGGAVDSVDGLTGVLTTGAIVNSLTEKVTVVDDDLVGGSDSQASNVSKKWKFSTIKAFLKTYFDSLYLVPQDVITTTVSITTATATDAGRTQNGRNILIKNGANAINITCNGGVTTTYQKGVGSTGAITFVQGSGRTLVQVSGTAILNGTAGSIASLTSDGTTDFLIINNL
jgi:hypothetical protein